MNRETKMTSRLCYVCWNDGTNISSVGFEGNPKEGFISMRIYGEKFDDLLHGNLLMNVAFASALGMSEN